MSSEFRELRQSLVENRHLAVTEIGMLIPIEIQLDELEKSASSRGYVMSLLEYSVDTDGSAVYIIHKRLEKPTRKLDELFLFDFRGGKGLYGLYVHAWNFNKFKKVVSGYEDDNQ